MAEARTFERARSRFSGVEVVAVRYEVNGKGHWSYVSESGSWGHTDDEEHFLKSYEFIR